MEPTTDNQHSTADHVYQYAANLLVNAKKSEEEVIDSLVKDGLDKENAISVVQNLQQQIKDAQKERAKKDMLYGGLWCIGGTVATFANIGFIFWGAIVFGAIQFFRGLANYQ